MPWATGSLVAGLWNVLLVRSYLCLEALKTKTVNNIFSDGDFGIFHISSNLWHNWKLKVLVWTLGKAWKVKVSHIGSTRWSLNKSSGHQRLRWDSMLNNTPYILFHINSGCLEPFQILLFSSLPSVRSNLYPFPCNKRDLSTRGFSEFKSLWWVINPEWLWGLPNL